MPQRTAPQSCHSRCFKGTDTERSLSNDEAARAQLRTPKVSSDSLERPCFARYRTVRTGHCVKSSFTDAVNGSTGLYCMAQVASRHTGTNECSPTEPTQWCPATK